MAKEHKWQWYVRIDGVWEEMHGRGSTSRFYITGYLHGKWWAWKDRKFIEPGEQFTLRRVYVYSHKNA